MNISPQMKNDLAGGHFIEVLLNINLM